MSFQETTTNIKTCNYTTVIRVRIVEDEDNDFVFLRKIFIEKRIYNIQITYQEKMNNGQMSLK